jgi:hypothetical protein
MSDESRAGENSVSKTNFLSQLSELTDHDLSFDVVENSPSSASSYVWQDDDAVKYIPPSTVDRLTQIKWSISSIKWAVKSLLADEEHRENLGVIRRLAPSLLKMRFDQLEVDIVKCKAELDPSSITCPVRQYAAEEELSLK